MSTPTEHTVKVLNSLIETTLDSARGYKEAAESSEDASFKSMFSERSLKRMKLTGDLQEEVRTFGGEPEQDQSMLGKAHNKFVDLKAAVRQCNPNITKFDCSCFDGEYITGDITEEYLDRVEAARAGGKANKTPDDDQMELDLVMSASSM